MSVEPQAGCHDEDARRKKASAVEYVWIAYSIFFFFEPIARNNRVYWLKCLALFVPFLAVYIFVVRARSPRTRIALLATLCAMGLVGMSFNGGASCFLILASGFLPFMVEGTTTVVACLAGQIVLVLLEGRLLHLEWVNVVIALVLMSVVGTTNLFMSQKKRSTDALLRAQEEIEQLAALAERERIARDMHDVLGHTLSVIVLKSELAGRLMERNPEAAAAEIADVESTARRALAEVREAIGGYRAQGLPSEIDQARRTLATAGVILTSDLAPELRLSPTQETAIALAIREAVTNVVRHARATSCDLRLTVDATGEHILTLTDNGTTLAGVAPREGNGLRGMRERVTSLGGTLSFTSSPSGTTLCIHLPSSIPALAGTDALLSQTSVNLALSGPKQSGARSSRFAPADGRTEPVSQ